MIFTKKANSLPVLTTAVSLAVAGMVAPLAAQAELTGNINVVSKYVLRGITTGVYNGTSVVGGPENSNTSVQGGFDYSHESGIYAGYWGSNLGYTTNDTGMANNSALVTGFESDLYAGYKGKAGKFSYGIGAVYYLYTGVANSDGAELVLTGGLGNATLGINYLLQDVAWGNQGDTYITLGYTQALPSDFSLVGTLMYYFYTEDGKYITGSTNPDAISSGFRGLSLALNHPIGKTGATMGLTLVGGGEDRNGVYQKWMPVLSVGATF